MEIGMGIFGDIAISQRVAQLKKNGVSKTFIMAEMPDFDNVMKLFEENGIVCETLHAPFDKINDMWGEGREAAEKMLNRLKQSVDRCSKYNIAVLVVHLSSGCPMPEINEYGIKRFEALFDYAKQNNVIIALENQRFLENLEFFLSKYKDTAFCWDCGHENCFTNGIRFMKLFGKRLGALHIHDNRCGVNTDDHLLPFDGNIDFEEVAEDIAVSGYEGTVMLEINRFVSIDEKVMYKDLSDDEYCRRAAQAARKLLGMIENCRNDKKYR